MGARLYNVLKWAPENSIWRMKSLKWMMDQTINYSMIHFTPSISSSVQRNKSRWLNIVSLVLLALQVFAIQTRRGDLVTFPNLKYHPFLYICWPVSTLKWVTVSRGLRTVQVSKLSIPLFLCTYIRYVVSLASIKPS